MAGPHEVIVLDDTNDEVAPLSACNRCMVLEKELQSVKGERDGLVTQTITLKRERAEFESKCQGAQHQLSELRAKCRRLEQEQRANQAAPPTLSAAQLKKQVSSLQVNKHTETVMLRLAIEIERDPTYRPPSEARSSPS